MAMGTRMASALLAFAALSLLANKPGAATRAPHCSAFASAPKPWFGHPASCRQLAARDQIPIEKGLFNHRQDAVPTGSLPPVGRGLRRRGSSQIRISRATTRLQVSASLQGRRGIKRPQGEGGTQIPELIAAPVEAIEDIDHYFSVLAAYHDSIVVIKVYATFCRACKAFDRKYRQMAIDYEKAGANVKFCDMNWMTNRDLCKSLQVKKLPHIELYAGERGRLESFVCGPRRTGLLEEKLDLLLANPSDPNVGASIPAPLDRQDLDMDVDLDVLSTQDEPSN